MLARYQVELIRKLLSLEKISRRRIAQVTGVSREAVEMIATGKHSETPSEGDGENEQPLESPRRCHRCGAWVHPPCVSCRMRAFIQNHLDNVALGLPLNCVLIVGLDLKPRHFARYQEVRRRRRAMEKAVGCWR